MKKVNYFFCIDLSKHQFSSDLKNCINEFMREPNYTSIQDDFDFLWVNSEKYHTTIFYIGPLVQEKLKITIHNLKDIISKFNEFEIKIRSLEYFSKRNHSPIVLLINDDNNVISKINESIKSYMKENLPEAKDCKNFRKFKPHITIGRIRKIIQKELKLKLSNFFNKFNKNYLTNNKYQIQKIKLMHLDPETRNYQTDYVFELKEKIL